MRVVVVKDAGQRAEHDDTSGPVLATTRLARHKLVTITVTVTLQAPCHSLRALVLRKRQTVS